MGKGGVKPAGGSGGTGGSSAEEKPKGWSTGKKIAVGAGVGLGVAAVGAACVAGALLAEGDGLEDLGATWSCL